MRFIEVAPRMRCVSRNRDAYSQGLVMFAGRTSHEVRE